MRQGGRSSGIGAEVRRQEQKEKQQQQKTIKIIGLEEDKEGERENRDTKPVPPSFLPSSVPGFAVNRAEKGGLRASMYGRSSPVLLSPSASPSPNSKTYLPTYLA